MEPPEKDKCSETRLKIMLDDDHHGCHKLENNLTASIKTILKTVCNLFGSILIVSYLMSSSFCILREDISRAYLTSTLLAGAGLSSLILGLFSSKITITGGSRYGYLVCAILYLNQPFQVCLGSGDVYAMGPELRTTEWLTRFQTVQGAVLFVSMVQIFIGLIGFDILIKFFKPVSIFPTMLLLSIFVMKTSAPILADGCWKLFSFTCFLMFLFYFVYYRFSKAASHVGPTRSRTGPRHKLVIGFFAVLLVWCLCALFSTFERLRLKNAAGTDIFNGAPNSAIPFIVPCLFQWGLPKFKLNALFIMLPAAYISIFETLASYYVNGAKKSDCRAEMTYGQRKKIYDKNIWSTFLVLEGVFTVLVSSVGPPLGITVDLRSRNQRVCSIVTAAVMLLAATSGILCALMTTIPEPIMAAFIFVMFLSAAVESMYTHVNFLGFVLNTKGFTLVRCINMNSTRNHYVLGLSLFLGLLLPEFFRRNSDSLVTGYSVIDDVFSSILTTEFLIGGIVAVILDNVVDLLVGPDNSCKNSRTHDKVTDNAESGEADSSSPICDCILPFFA